MNKSPFKSETIAAQAAGAVDAAGAGVVPGIQPATTFLRGPDNALLRGDKIYGRDDNDTVRQAEEILNQLEGAAATLLFPSGMAAAAAVFRTVSNGGRVVLQSGIYWGVTKWAQDFCARRDIMLDQVDASDLDALSTACAQPADLVWIEVPSNPWLKITDIAAASDLAHRAGAILAVDGTAAPPTMTQALQFGADIVMHSATKAINGHTDVLAGVLSCADAGSAAWQAIALDRHDAGAIIGPFEAWLLMRGIRTLPLRLERMSANAQAIAEYLATHDRVEAVWYPGLRDHPGYELAKRQMQGGFGYMLSVVVNGGETAALAAIGRLSLFHRATSLGGVESLVEHRHSIEPHSGIPPGLLRLSVGIEHIDDLIADLDQALRG
ncbi:PLP-dependent aspartate aminotransferase family protein [Roseovarius sp. EL26]|uniref:trans-sulfuration enzyme family protein n=1 Tax=Roseovarius sp. EL26 TaxID=2126672 RepID=UPI000EA32B71|nr:aminotransferase class I/II-fold pyridoxal phosphate-dependent enzyme [Roseovarius sp. EL26]